MVCVQSKAVYTCIYRDQSMAIRNTHKKSKQAIKTTAKQNKTIKQKSRKEWMT